jgi:hypothetical protein
VGDPRRPADGAAARRPQPAARLRAHLGVSRLSLPDKDEAHAATGYERGAITPFGSTRAWPVIADASMMDLELVAIGGAGGGSTCISRRGISSPPRARPLST